MAATSHKTSTTDPKSGARPKSIQKAPATQKAATTQKAPKKQKAPKTQKAKKPKKIPRAVAEKLPARTPAPFQWAPFTRRQLKIMTWWMPDSPFRDYAGIIADGAIRSGKTLCMSVSYVLWAMETFNQKKFGLSGQSIGSLKRNLVTEEWKLIMSIRGFSVADCKRDNTDCLVVTKGIVTNYFYLFGGHDEASYKAVQGITLAGFLFDEVVLQPESFVTQAMARCSVAGSKFWFNCNPGHRLHWFKIKYINRYIEMRLLYLHFTMDDNLSLTEEIRDRYRQMYTGVFYRRYIEGLWVAAEGIIYPMWSEELNSYDDSPDAPLPFAKPQCSHWVACDYGSTNPTAFLDIYYDGYTCWIVAEYYQDSRKDQQSLSPSQHADAMEQFLDGDHSPVIIIDPAAKAFRLELRNRGFRCREAVNDVLDGIRMVQTMLVTRRVRVAKSLKNFRREIESYRWDEKAAETGKEQPVKVMDHCLAGDTIIETLRGPRRIQDLKGKCGIVYCWNEKKQRKTWGFFYRSSASSTNAMLYEVTMEDGRTIRGTGDHRVLTLEGWKPIAQLTAEDRIIEAR